MSIYVCSDIHGRKAEFDMAISQLKPEDTLYILGDATDNRSENDYDKELGIEILKSIINYQERKQKGEKVPDIVYIKGNHDYDLEKSIHIFYRLFSSNSIAFTDYVSTLKSWFHDKDETTLAFSKYHSLQDLKKARPEFDSLTEDEYKLINQAFENAQLGTWIQYFSESDEIKWKIKNFIQEANQQVQVIAGDKSFVLCHSAPFTPKELEDIGNIPMKIRADYTIDFATVLDTWNTTYKDDPNLNTYLNIISNTFIRNTGLRTKDNVQAYRIPYKEMGTITVSGHTPNNTLTDQNPIFTIEDCNLNMDNGVSYYPFNGLSLLCLDNGELTVLFGSDKKSEIEKLLENYKNLSEKDPDNETYQQHLHNLQLALQYLENPTLGNATEQFRETWNSIPSTEQLLEDSGKSLLDVVSSEPNDLPILIFASPYFTNKCIELLLEKSKNNQSFSDENIEMIINFISYYSYFKKLQSTYDKELISQLSVILPAETICEKLLSVTDYDPNQDFPFNQYYEFINYFSIVYNNSGLQGLTPEQKDLLIKINNTLNRDKEKYSLPLKIISIEFPSISHIISEIENERQQPSKATFSLDGTQTAADTEHSLDGTQTAADTEPSNPLQNTIPDTTNPFESVEAFREYYKRNHNAAISKFINYSMRNALYKKNGLYNTEASPSWNSQDEQNLEIMLSFLAEEEENNHLNDDEIKNLYSKLTIALTPKQLIDCIYREITHGNDISSVRQDSI